MIPHHIERTLQAVPEILPSGRRFVISVAGAPGSGKSTFADALVPALDDRFGAGAAAVFPMDGFHFDNAVIEPRGWLPRKGAPETFDVFGFRLLLEALRARPDTEIAVPVFDRDRDLARGSARLVGQNTRIVVTEGNYLLLRDEPWSGLRTAFDLAVFLSVPEAELERRLIDRWIGHGLSPDAARSRATGNDLANARLVVARSGDADVLLRPGFPG